MNDEVLAVLAEYLEKQDLLSKLTEKDLLHSYSYSEIHFIHAVGVIDHANVTKISKHLKITRGAVSRMAKKQMGQNLIQKYTLQENKKEIYFCLTPQGEELFHEHQKRHALWKQRDTDFLNQYSEETIEQICQFFKEYNGYLSEQIERLQ